MNTNYTVRWSGDMAVSRAAVATTTYYRVFRRANNRFGLVRLSAWEHFHLIRDLFPEVDEAIPVEGKPSTTQVFVEHDAVTVKRRQ